MLSFGFIPFFFVFLQSNINSQMSKKQRYCSFSKRLTRRIMLALTLALIVVAACFNWIEADVFTRYDKVYCKLLLDVKNETVRKALYGVEVAVMNSTDDLEEQLQSPATVFNALSDELQRNPQIVGFFACFEPDYYPSRGRSFQPYAFWHGNRIDTMQIARKGNDYLEDDWYRRAFAADSGYCRSPIWTIQAGICWFAPTPYPSTTTWDAK